LLFEEVIAFCGISYINSSSIEEAARFCAESGSSSVDLRNYRTNIQSYCRDYQHTRGITRLVTDIVCNPLDLVVNRDGIWLWKGGWRACSGDLAHDPIQMTKLRQLLNAFLESKEHFLSQKINLLRGNAFELSSLAAETQHCLDNKGPWRLKALVSLITTLLLVGCRVEGGMARIWWMLQSASQSVTRAVVLQSERPSWWQEQLEMICVLERFLPSTLDKPLTE